MNDLISKNQSLVEWKEDFKGFVECLDIPRDDYNGIMAYIDEVPSAEPERKLELHGDESAIEILSELRSWFSCFDEKEGLAYHALSLAIRAIKANSIVQAERKKGKWQWCGNHHLCSECDEWVLTRWNEDECDEVDILTDFCPNCGADMRGDKDEDR